MNQKTVEESALDQNSRDITASFETKSQAKTNSIDMPSSAQCKVKNKSKRPNGRLSKRKTRKTVRIKGLDAIDFLHNETLLSTAPKDGGQKSPPPQGCVDYKFTSLTSLAADTVPIHTELPPATYETPYALQVLLDMYREQFLAMIRCMRTDDFRKNVEIQIIDEKEKKRKLTAKLEQLEKQINLLIGDSLKLLRTRMSELGVANGYNAKDLMVKAKEIMSQHNELQGEAFQLNHEIPVLQGENAELRRKNKDDDDDSVEKLPSSATIADNCDGFAPNMEVKIEPPEYNCGVKVKTETLDYNSGDDDVPLSEFQAQLNAVEPKTETPKIKLSVEDFNVTPCSIVLPRIMDGTKLKLLTPAQKKFACSDLSSHAPIEDPPAVRIPLNNENKPPTEKHSSSHKHRHKKSHKSKKKHRHQDAHEQRESYSSRAMKPPLPPTPSYSSMTSNVMMDPIEDIITRTLNDSSGNLYPHTSSAVVAPPAPNYLSHSITNGGFSDRTDQSDYRRVPPMKIALKKFAQESRDFQSTHSPSVMRTTVGDLVSSEIEKSLEISNRSTMNQLSVPYDYDAMNNRPTSKRSCSDRRDLYSNTNYEQFSSKSPFLTPTYVMPSPSHSSAKNSPKFKEEAFEGLAASMFSAVNASCRSSEADGSRHSTPYCTPPMNLEFKPSESHTFPQYLCSKSSSSSAMRLPSEASFSADQKNHADGNKWQDVSLCFDRMFEFVSNKLDSQDNVPSKEKLKSRMKDSTASDKHSPTFALNPPPLFRADSSFSTSPLRPDLPVSPASLEGPFSPVPSLSPSPLPSPISSSHSENKDERSNYNEKFRPKGKGWRWS